MPYSGFSPVRLQAQAPHSSVCRLPSCAPQLSLIPDIPADSRTFTSAFETTVHQPGGPPLSVDLGRCPSLLSPEVLALAGLSCPCLRRLATSSASLKTSTSLPSMAGYSGGLWHSRTFLPGRHTFRTFTAVLSRIAACSFRRESGTCTPMLPYQRWPSGRGKKPLATPILPQSASRGDPISTARSFALATALLVARLLG
jgi:hypothetical protein